MAFAKAKKPQRYQAVSSGLRSLFFNLRCISRLSVIFAEQKSFLKVFIILLNAAY